jgi:hypothetical protein
MAFQLHVLREDDLFVDVATNVGAHANLVFSAISARGLAYEPAPSPYVRLLGSGPLNQARDNVLCVHLAVAGVRGTIALAPLKVR